MLYFENILHSYIDSYIGGKKLRRAYSIIMFQNFIYFMFEQQLQVTEPILSRQSEVDWSRVQKLYHQTAKIVHPPEPDYFGSYHLGSSKYSLHDFEQVLGEILKEIKINNNKQIQLLESKFNEDIRKLQKRIQKLEGLLLESNIQKDHDKPTKETSHSGYHTPISKSEQLLKEVNTAQTRLNGVKSFIYIEDHQDKEISLLDDDEKIEYQESPRQSLKDNDQPEKPSSFTEYVPFTPRKSIDEQREVENMINRNRILNVSCKFHEKELKQLRTNINSMKKYLEEVYQMQIKDIPESNGKRNFEPQDGERLNMNQKIIFNVSTHSEQHLVNENLALREVVEKYRRELIKNKNAVNDVASLLWEGLQKSKTSKK